MNPLALAAALSLAATAAVAGGWRTFEPARSDRVLRHQDNGMAFMPSLTPVDRIPGWILDACSIAYFRLDWAAVADEEGRPGFGKVDREVIAGYRERGLHPSFRIMAANPHSRERYVTPKAVLDRFKIPTVTHRSAYGEEQVDPVFWDPRFVGAYNELTEALGAYLRGRPAGGPVDLGGMGDWGEMHLGRWTAEELSAHGFTYGKYLRAVESMMAAMDRHLPRVTKAFCVAPILMPDPGPAFAQLVDRAVRRGWWLRSDGCSLEGPPPYVKPYAEAHWRRAGIICEPSGGINRGYHGGEVDPGAYLEANLAWRPSVINLMGLWDLGKLTSSQRRTVTAAARRTGSRLVVERAVVPREIVPGRPFAVGLSILQAGSAPHHGTLAGFLEAERGGVTEARADVLPVPPLSTLGPGERREAVALLEVPADAKPGTLRLAFGVEDLRTGPVPLAHEPADRRERITLGSLRVGRAAGAPAGVLFDHGRGDRPVPAEGVALEEVEAGTALRGTSEGGWNYGSAPENYDVEPKTWYRMRVRLRARSPEGAGPLYFKFGVERADGSWGGNFNTSKYDFTKPGTWQVLETVYRPGPEDARFGIAIEKGSTSAAALDAVIADWTVERIPLP